MVGNIGPLEIGIVLVIALLVFGPKRLPELGAGLGRGIRDFKSGLEGSQGEVGEPALGASENTGASAAPSDKVEK
jgi:sec-independent protein translocase protein TatA